MPCYPQRLLLTTPCCFTCQPHKHEAPLFPKMAWTWLRTTWKGPLDSRTLRYSPDQSTKGIGNGTQRHHGSPSGWPSISLQEKSHRCLGEWCVWAMVSSGCNCLRPSSSTPSYYSVPSGHPSMPHTSTQCSVKMRHRCFNPVHSTESQQQQHAESPVWSQADHRDIRAHQNTFWFTGLQWGWKAKNWYFLKLPRWFQGEARDENHCQFAAFIPNTPSLFPICCHHSVPIWLLTRGRVFLANPTVCHWQCIWLSCLTPDFLSRAFIRHTLSTLLSSDFLERTLDILCFMRTNRKKKNQTLIFIKHIYDPNPVSVCMADFCNKYPNSQWPDTIIKVYFLLVTEPKMQKAGRAWRKRQTTADYRVAVLINKRTFLPGLSWAATTWVNLHTHTRQILKVYIEDLTGFSHTVIQTVSILHSILKLYPWRSFWK